MAKEKDGGDTVFVGLQSLFLLINLSIYLSPQINFNIGRVR